MTAQFRPSLKKEEEKGKEKKKEKKKNDDDDLFKWTINGLTVWGFEYPIRQNCIYKKIISDHSLIGLQIV